MKILSTIFVVVLFALAASAQNASENASDEVFECGLTWNALVAIELSLSGRGPSVGHLGYRDFVVKYDGETRDIEFFLPSRTNPGRYIVGFALQDWEEQEFQRNGIDKLSVALTPRMRTLGLKVVVERVELSNQ